MINAGLVEWVKANLEKKAETNRGHDHLSQLTIVIPSFCRQDYLLRQIAYWSFSKVTIIIADGSPVPIDSQLLDLISDIRNIKYLNLNDSYVNRLKEACKYIKTPYAMCLADDDFFLMEGLCQTIDYLNKNGEIVACIGQAIGVDYDDKKMSTYYFPYGGSLENYQVQQKYSVTRVHYGIDNYRTATSYAVFRASTFKDIWRSIQMTSCLEATEYEHAITTYAIGKLSTIANIYWLRSFECEPIDSLIDGTRKLDFLTWWNSEEYKLECVNFVRRLAIKLSENSFLNEQDSSNEINKIINYILSKRHTGLVNKNLFMMILSGVIKGVNNSSYLHKCFTKVKSTHIGRIIRNCIIAAIRGATVDSTEFPVDQMSNQTSLEIKNILVFITNFHAAKRGILQ